MTRISWNDYFLNMAKAAATRSTCPRLSVGAVLTLNNYILSSGYNGAPSGEQHCDDIGCEMVDGHCKRARHAEVNAVTTLSKINQPVFSRKSLREKMVLYCTHKPCKYCEAILTGYGITNIVYDKEYP